MIKIMIIKICPREKNAPKVQHILTDFGEFIKARLGLHNVEAGTNSSTGIVILHLTSEEKYNDNIISLKEELESIDGVTVQLQVM